MSSELINLLSNLSISVSASAIYDLVKSLFASKNAVSKTELQNAIAAQLKIDNASVIAEKIVHFLAKNGDINIRGSYIYAGDSIVMASARGTKFVFGDGSTSETKKTKIDTGKDAFIQGQGGARIKQNPNGSISFEV